MFNNTPEDDFYRYQDNLDPERQQGAVIKKRLAELRGEQTAGFYRPDKPTSPRVTVTETESSAAGDSLEQDNCIHCHAAYGHKISCPKLNRAAAEEIQSIDTFWLKTLRISNN